MPTDTFAKNGTILVILLSAVLASAETKPAQPPSQDPNLLTKNPVARQHVARGRAIYSLRRQKCSWKSDPDCESAQLGQVVDEANAALVVDPDYAAAHNLLGLAFTDQQKFDQAIAEFQEALRLIPEYYQAHQNLGLALAGKGDLVAAFEELREALRLKPGSAEVHRDLGGVLMAKGQGDEGSIRTSGSDSSESERCR